MREEEIKQLEIDKIHWRDLYWEECEKNKKLEQENKKLNEKLLWNEEIFIKSDNDFKYWFKKARELMEENKKLKAEIQEWINAVNNK